MLNNKSKFFQKIKNNFPLLFTFIFWIIISILLINFVNLIFKSEQDEVINKEKLLILFLIALSVFLIIIIIIYIFKLFISVSQKKFGARMKIKITLIFIFIVLLPVFPLIQISIKFINSSMDLWFSQNIGVALDLSEEIIKSYFNEKKELLLYSIQNIKENVTKNNINFKLLNENLILFYKNLKLTNITLWNEKGEIINQVGKPLFDIYQKKEITNNSKILLIENLNNFFIEEKNNSLYLILPTKIIDYNNNLLGFLNISLEISPLFNKVTKEIDNSLKNYNLVSIYKNFFSFGFIILFIGILSPIILLILIISIFLSKELLDPINDLSIATERVAKGDYNFKIESTFNDEFQILANSFNIMLNELEIAKIKLQQKEKIAAWQEIAKRLAHEIKNPLTPIRLSSERILKKYNEKSIDFEHVLKKGITTIINEVENMDKLLEEFSNLARLPNINKTKGGIINIINSSIDLLSANIYNIKFEVISKEEDYELNRDELQLKSVFVNILKNSIESMRKEGVIKIILEKQFIRNKNFLLISIIDNGEGIDLEYEQHIFEPYFSTKKNGVGLGLTIAQRIIIEHEGRIYFTSKKNVETIFYIELPLL